MKRLGALVMALAGLFGQAWALEGAAGVPTGYGAENSVMGSQENVISSTLAAGLPPFTVSLTDVANCGVQGKFYYTPKGTCCGISDTSLDCSLAPPVTPGSQTFSSAGTYDFVVQPYNTLTVTVRGGGGGGGGVGNARSSNCGAVGNGSGGGTSSFLSVVASGGGGGSGSVSDQCAAGGAGGASGGDSNSAGAAGNGGSGAQYAVTRSYTAYGGSGGGGGVASKTWGASGGPAAGSHVTVTVGGGGGGGSGYISTGGSGGTGSVVVSWQ